MGSDCSILYIMDADSGCSVDKFRNWVDDKGKIMDSFIITLKERIAKNSEESVSVKSDEGQTYVLTKTNLTFGKVNKDIKLNKLFSYSYAAYAMAEFCLEFFKYSHIKEPPTMEDIKKCVGFIFDSLNALKGKTQDKQITRDFYFNSAFLVTNLIGTYKELSLETTRQGNLNIVKIPKELSQNYLLNSLYNKCDKTNRNSKILAKVINYIIGRPDQKTLIMCQDCYFKTIIFFFGDLTVEQIRIFGMTLKSDGQDINCNGEIVLSSK